MSWLPPEPEPPDPPDIRPWQPRRHRRVDFAGCWYVAIDEMIGSVVGLSASEWPQVDAHGRLYFPGGRGHPVPADHAELARFLGDHRVPRVLAGRDLKIGDVFAFRVGDRSVLALPEETAEADRAEPAGPPAPESWIQPPVYDITADARAAAKVAFYSSVADPLAPEQAVRVALSSPDQPATDEADGGEA